MRISSLISEVVVDSKLTRQVAQTFNDRTYTGGRGMRAVFRVLRLHKGRAINHEMHIGRIEQRGLESPLVVERSHFLSSRWMGWFSHQHRFRVAVERQSVLKIG